MQPRRRIDISHRGPTVSFFDHYELRLEPLGPQQYELPDYYRGSAALLFHPEYFRAAKLLRPADIYDYLQTQEPGSLHWHALLYIHARLVKAEPAQKSMAPV